MKKLFVLVVDKNKVKGFGREKDFVKDVLVLYYVVLLEY